MNKNVVDEKKVIELKTAVVKQHDALSTSKSHLQDSTDSDSNTCPSNVAVNENYDPGKNYEFVKTTTKDSGMSTSFYAHFLPTADVSSPCNLARLPSFISHYVFKPNVKLIPVEQVVEVFSRLLDELRKDRKKMIEELKIK